MAAAMTRRIALRSKPFAAPAAGETAGAAGLILSADRSTSAMVIEPSAPVPAIEDKSTPSSCARLRANGETRRRAEGSGAGTIGIVKGAAVSFTGAAGAGDIASGLAGAASAFLPSALNIASVAPTGTFCPGWTTRDSITPVSKISTSMTPFSVSTSATTSPRLTVSPGLTRQSTTVPNCMSAPSEGMRNSLMAGHHPSRRGDDARNLRDCRVFKMFWIGHRQFDAANARHGRIELVKGIFHDPRHDLGGDAAAFPAFVDDQGTMRAADGIDDRGRVQRPQRAQIDDFGVDAFARKIFSSLYSFKQRAAV